MSLDLRNILTGTTIPSEGYCDQPYIVINSDGSWTCVMTTGSGNEGDAGQHVVSVISRDQGKTWEGPFDIEQANSPESSWAMPFLVPETGRIYAFYTFNHLNQREVKTINGKTFSRVDSFGSYAYKYSDDGGRNWSSQRYEIPMRLFDIDRENVYGGEVMFFWGVGKPFIHRGKVYVCASKVGGFGPGFFSSNEGVLFVSDNLRQEHRPEKHHWKTLPDGEQGLKAPENGGPIAGELNTTPMNDGSLYCTYRTIGGWSCHGYSRDDGHSWNTSWMTYEPNGRRVKNPRSANFVRRFKNGHYLYWFCFNGGEVLAKFMDKPWRAYEHRNPIWMCGGVEKDGYIYWSEPEIILFDEVIGNRISYPDFIEDGNQIFVSETQKEEARVHQLSPKMLSTMWNHLDNNDVCRKGLIAEASGTEIQNSEPWPLPQLPALHIQNHDPLHQRGGFSLELWVSFKDLKPWQVLFDSRDEEDQGLLVQLTDRKTLQLTIRSRSFGTPGSTLGNGGVVCSWDCDRKLLKENQTHQVLFTVDGGPRVITVMVDGMLCDGGMEREFGWARFDPNLKDPNGSPHAILAPSLNGKLEGVRLYDRPLLSNEGKGNWLASNGSQGTTRKGFQS